MCNYDELLYEANEKGLEIVEKYFKSDAKGLCKGNKIGIRKDLSSNEKACVLAEEIGHYETYHRPRKCRKQKTRKEGPQMGGR